RGDHVVRRHRIRCMRQGDFAHRGPELLHHSDGAIAGPPHHRIELGREVFFRQADHEALQRFGDGREPQRIPVFARRIPGIAPAAASAAEPPEEPPGTRVRSSGCRTRPYTEYSVEEPMANSSQFVLPAMRAPAALSLVIAVASYGD